MLLITTIFCMSNVSASIKSNHTLPATTTKPIGGWT